MDATIAIIVAVGTVILALADKVRQSRCSHLECLGCCECDREVIDLDSQKSHNAE